MKTSGIQGKHWEYSENTVNAIENIGKTLSIHGKHREYRESIGNTGKT